MINSPTEKLIEDVATTQLAGLGYGRRRGSELKEANLLPTSGIIGPLLRDALARLNPKLPRLAIEQVVKGLRQPPEAGFLANNRWFHQQLTTGFEVTYTDPETGETRSPRTACWDLTTHTRTTSSWSGS